MRIENILITGANRGIGLEFVKQFLHLPAAPNRIFATCRNPDKAKDLKEIENSNPNVKVLELDVLQHKNFPKFRQELEEELGEDGLNLLINNAGVAIRNDFGKITKESMMENFEINTVSPLLLAQELCPLLKRAASIVGGKGLSCGRAGIVNITSKMGSIDDNTSGGCYPYRTSKAALNMVTKSLAMDLKPDGILAFVLHPGWVLTEMGGPNALINTETSVRGMVETILNAGEKHCGLMFNYDGKVIPW